jgi:DNA invertase Pin-like site-specific DNA recombinase
MVERRTDDRRAEPRPAGDRRRGGRPLKPDARRMVLKFRVSESERSEIERIAKLNDQTLTEFIQEAISEAISDCCESTTFRRAS